MRAPTALTAVCLTTSAALLLTACGSGGSSASSSDKAQPAKSSSPSASPTTATASATPDGRPTITFPSYAKDVFEDQHTGDAVKDAILADNAEMVRSTDDAIFQGTTHTKALEYYNVGKGYEKAIVYVSGVLKDGYTWIGTTRFFDRKVTILAPGQAAVIYCSDESKSFLKNRKTGKIDNTPTTDQSYVLYNTDLKKNSQGVWQTDNVSSVRGAKQCQP